MPLLRDARRERFAQLVASGIPYTRAYVQAGYKASEKAAHRCRHRPDVSGRIDEILAAAAAKNDVTVERVIVELAKIAFADPGDYFDWGPDGVAILPKSGLTADQRAVVAEVSETRSETGGSIKLRLSDKQAALEKLGRHLGMFREKVEMTGKDGGPIETKDVSMLEAARRIAFTLAAGKQAKK